MVCQSLSGTSTVVQRVEHLVQTLRRLVPVSIGLLSMTLDVNPPHFGH